MFGLSGQKYQHCPSRLDHKYSVAGLFFITNLWATKTEELVYRVRFEKQDLASKSWWGAIATPMPPQRRDYSRRAPSRVCGACDQEFPQIYSSGWRCLNADCLKNTPMVSIPEYNHAFLAERSDASGKPKASCSLVPVLPMDNPGVPFSTFTRARGIACPKCKACISRISWSRWACDTEGCGFTHKMTHQTVSHKAFLGRLDHEVIGHAIPTGTCSYPVEERSSVCEGHLRMTIFDILPGCFVAHIQGNVYSNAAPRGPNEIFRGLQEVRDLPLERRKMSHSRIGQPMLTNHFAANYGMPYEYSARTPTPSVAFADAPDPVIAALGRLSWIAEKVVPTRTYQKVNEMLVCGYMFDNSMRYHDDGEKGLGDTIVALSVGGPADMNWRMKAKYYDPSALNKKNISRYDPKRKVLVGSKLWARRKELNDLYGQVSEEDWQVAKKEVYDEYAAFSGDNKKQCKNALEIGLRHGDYIVMHGAAIQKYYEVSPTCCEIFIELYLVSGKAGFPIHLSQACQLIWIYPRQILC